MAKIDSMSENTMKLVGVYGPFVRGQQVTVTIDPITGVVKKFDEEINQMDIDLNMPAIGAIEG